MPLHLGPLEALLTRWNVLPAPLLDTPIVPGMAKALVCACEMNVFDTLGQASLTLFELAERLNCSQQGLQLLLNLLVTSGYLCVRQGRYANTRMARRWLCSTSPRCIAPYIVHSPDIVELWDNLPQVVQSGQMAIRMPYEEESDTPENQALLARHYAGLAALATGLGDTIVSRIHLPQRADTLLDVGGSHAAFSAMLCQRYPRLQATILDLQAGLEAGKRTAKQLHLEDRLHFLRTDFIADDFGTMLAEQYDAALYAHIAHLLQPDRNQEVLTKVARTLKPGGQLVFVDQVVEQGSSYQFANVIVQLMALTMATVGGTCYPFTTVKQWLEQAGLSQVRSHRLLMPGVTMITAVKF